MNNIIGATIMMLGVGLIVWTLFNLYHGMPMSPMTFCVGTLCAFIGGKWVQGSSSNPI